jgi:hypothetical protein
MMMSPSHLEGEIRPPIKGPSAPDGEVEALPFMVFTPQLLPAGYLGDGPQGRELFLKIPILRTRLTRP